MLQCSSEDGQPLVIIGHNGDIHTASFNGHAVVMVTEHREELGINQSVAVHVEVGKITNISCLLLILYLFPLTCN